MSKGKVFTAQEVQAIIAGNKRMFREVIKVQPPAYIKNVNFAGQGTWEWGNSGVYVEEPYQKGQKIFVKESFSTDWVIYDNTFSDSCLDDIAYEATWEKDKDNAKGFFGFFDEPKWKPASQMKQEHSRLTLQIKEIRVERLQEISEEDAIAEGIEEATIPIFENIQPKIKSWKWYKKDNFGTYSAIKSFANLWNASHKKPEKKFEANPFVWSIQFEVVNE
jgi:hypothetical protein